MDDDVFEPHDSQDDIDDGQRDRLRQIVSALREIVSRLDDVHFDILREASSKRTGRPAIDKPLSQARRSVEKAIHLLDE